MNPELFRVVNAPLPGDIPYINKAWGCFRLGGLKWAVDNRDGDSEKETGA